MRKKKSSTTQRRPPTIEALRALLIHAETESVSETARRLGVSQPVVTKKLAVFKDAKASGAVLLRSNQRVTLTESAKSILPALHDLICRYDRISRFLRGEESFSQLIRIGAGSFAAEHYLPKVLTKIRDQFEDCQVETRVCRGRDRILGVAAGGLDLGIVTHSSNQICQLLRDQRLDERILTIAPLGEQPLCLAANRKTAAGRELSMIPASEPAPLARLQNWELIGPDRDSGIRRQLESRFAMGRLYFVAEGGGWAAAKEYARAGIGVAILPRATISAADQRQLVCRKLSRDFTISESLLYRANDNSPVLRKVRDLIVKVVKAIPKDL